MDTSATTWLDEAKKNAGMLIVFGVVEIIVGVLAIAAPAIAGGAVAVMIGILLVAAGIARLFSAFLADSFGSGTLTFIWGLIVAASGFYFMIRPGLGMATLALLLAVVFFVDGILRVIMSFKMKPVSGWGWMLFGGIVSVVLAIMIWRQFPLSGVWMVGTLVGINLLFSGFTTISVATAAKRAASAV